MLNAAFSQKTIDALMDAPLLLKCGQPVSQDEFGPHQTVSKTDAERNGLSQEWEHYSQARSHDLTAHLIRRARSASDQHWNEFSKKFREIWEDIMLPKVTYGLACAKLHHELEAAIHWDLFNVVMRESFLDFRPPTFFERIGHIYFAGHFPCGVSDFTASNGDRASILIY